MAKLTKNRKESLTKFDAEKMYSLKEASDVIKSFSKLKFESGTHRVQRIPKTESQGRIHTSACTVAIIAEADEMNKEEFPILSQAKNYRLKEFDTESLQNLLKA